MRLFEDLRYAARQLAHTRGFTAVAVVTLALGIAGTTMFFAAVNAIRLPRSSQGVAPEPGT